MVVQEAGDVLYIPQLWAAGSVLLTESVGVIEAFGPNFTPERSELLYLDPKGEAVSRDVRVIDA